MVRRSGAGLLRRYYEGYDEWNRLVSEPYHRLELDTTLHFLRKYLPRDGTLLDAGGGPGRYTIELAKMGYKMVLFDLLPKHLQTARKEAANAAVEGRVVECAEGSIEDLSRFQASSFDAVLCLGGTLGHILSRTRRSNAIRELRRVARRSAPIFVSVVGRNAKIINKMANKTQEWEDYPNIYARISRTGDYHGELGFAPSHFFFLDELKAELRRGGLRVVECVGLEGLSSTHPREVNRMAKSLPIAWKAWLEVHLQTCNLPAIADTSDHFLVICRKS
ncbi:MAG: class I SAM-dependent methyltransferase [Nitrososphaerota archaeon]|nr:class I SAM-dependent methyltransferase [Nitrososphaerota archaeon]